MIESRAPLACGPIFVEYYRRVFVFVLAECKVFRFLFFYHHNYSISVQCSLVNHLYLCVYAIIQLKTNTIEYIPDKDHNNDLKLSGGDGNIFTENK